jgi:integrase/recombinase XerD
MTRIQMQAQQYLEYCQNVRKFTTQTMRSKTWIIGKFVKEIGIKDLKKLTNGRFDKWRVDQQVSARTTNTRTDHVIAFLKYVNGGLKLKEFDFSKVHRMQVEDPEIKFYTTEQIQSVQKLAMGVRDQLLVSVAFEAGLRLTELATLSVESFDGTTIRILGKGGKRRPAFISETTRTILDRWLSLNGIDQGYIFPSAIKFNEPMSVDNVRLVLKQLFARAGIQTFHPHQLRHSCATTLISNGADLLTTQEIMGHSDPKTTKRYIHILASTLKAKHQKFMRFTNVQEASA